MVVEDEIVHPVASLTLTEYIPAAKLVMVYIPPELAISVPPGLPLLGPAQLTLYPEVAPLAVTFMAPELAPLQTILTGDRFTVGWVQYNVTPDWGMETLSIWTTSALALVLTTTRIRMVDPDRPVAVTVVEPLIPVPAPLA